MAESEKILTFRSKNPGFGPKLCFQWRTSILYYVYRVNQRTGFCNNGLSAVQEFQTAAQTRYNFQIKSFQVRVGTGQ